MHELSVEQGVSLADLQDSLKEDGMRLSERAAKYTWSRLAQLAGLDHRSVVSISKRVRRLLHENKGEWSPEEEEKLSNLVEQHGKKWKDIAVEFGCSRENVRDKWRHFTTAKKARFRQWTDAEKHQLRTGVLEVMGQLAPVSDIPWEEVYRYVLTRGAFSCMQQWYYRVLPHLLNYQDKHGYPIPPVVLTPRKASPQHER
eukprot:5535910-Amphidinium_carterae.1